MNFLALYICETFVCSTLFWEKKIRWQKVQEKNDTQKTRFSFWKHAKAAI